MEARARARARILELRETQIKRQNSMVYSQRILVISARRLSLIRYIWIRRDFSSISGGADERPREFIVQERSMERRTNVLRDACSHERAESSLIFHSMPNLGESPGQHRFNDAIEDPPRPRPCDPDRALEISRFVNAYEIS